ncbi:MAG: hypothetical protein R3D32_01895 [Nitratireductor sp.]
MRYFVLIAALLLAACATKPNGDSYTYKGVHVAGGAMIGDDDSFRSTATVWRAEDVELAKEAAIVRLAKAAAGNGYTHVTIASYEVTGGFGRQVVITGSLYRDDPGGNSAWPLLELGDAVANPGKSPADLAPKQPVPLRKPVRAVAPAETPAAPVGAPVVIEAPDFISAVPTPRPIG